MTKKEGKNRAMFEKVLRNHTIFCKVYKHVALNTNLKPYVEPKQAKILRDFLKSKGSNDYLKIKESSPARKRKLSTGTSFNGEIFKV